MKPLNNNKILMLLLVMNIKGLEVGNARVKLFTSPCWPALHFVKSVLMKFHSSNVFNTLGEGLKIIGSHILPISPKVANREFGLLRQKINENAVTILDRFTDDITIVNNTFLQGYQDISAGACQLQNKVQNSENTFNHLQQETVLTKKKVMSAQIGLAFQQKKIEELTSQAQDNTAGIRNTGEQLNNHMNNTIKQFSLLNRCVLNLQGDFNLACQIFRKMGYELPDHVTRNHLSYILNNPQDKLLKGYKESDVRGLAIAPTLLH